MEVLEVMQKKNSLYLLLDIWYAPFPLLPGLDPRIFFFFRTVDLEFKSRILYTCKEKHKIRAGSMTNLKNLRPFITSCSHLKIYVSFQESNEMQHSGVKWSFLMCQDSHVGFFFFSVLPVGSNPKETWYNPVISTQWRVGKVAAFLWEAKGLQSDVITDVLWCTWLPIKFWEAEQKNERVTVTWSLPLAEQLTRG